MLGSLFTLKTGGEEREEANTYAGYSGHQLNPWQCYQSMHQLPQPILEKNIIAPNIIH